MRVLVTGAAGFIGSHLLHRLQRMGVSVHGIDNFSSYYSTEYKKLRLKSLKLEISKDLTVCDISNYSELQRVVSSFKPSFIIHLAAQAGVRLNLKESDAYILANIQGFQNVIRASVEYHLDGVLYASSSSVYGDTSPTPYREKSVTLRPKSIYGATKLSNELFAEIYAKTCALRLRGLRLFTVYGPWGRPDMAYFRIAAAALGQEQFTLFGDGSIKRDFTYIDDVVNSIVALFQDLTNREEQFNDFVNIGGGRPLEMNYLIDLISRMGDLPLVIKKSDESKLDSRVTMADNTYLQSIIGMLEFTGLEQGVENLMNWAREEKIKRNLSGWIRSTF